MILGRLEYYRTTDGEDRLHALCAHWHVQPIGADYRTRGTRVVTLQFEFALGRISVYIHGGFQEGMRWYSLWTPWTALVLLLSLLAFGL